MGVPGKYRFPDQAISPGGFLVVWLDGQPEQGDRHAPFRISREGEEIRLSGRPAEGFTIIDSLTFGPQETDLAMGRSVDGGMEWITFSQPTPGFSNLSTGLEEFLAHGEPLLLYPNPVTDGTLHFSRRCSGTVYNIMGRPVMRVAFSDRADVGSLGSGLFIFDPGDGAPVRFVVAGN